MPEAPSREGGPFKKADRESKNSLYSPLSIFPSPVVCVCVRLCECVYLIGACDVKGKIHNSACVYQKWANIHVHIYRPGPFSGKTPVVPSRRLLHPLHNGFRNLVYLLRMQHGHMYAINKNYGASQICTEIPSRSILAKMSSGLDFFAEIASNIART